MKDKELERIAEDIAEAVNNGKPEEAVRILRSFTGGDTKTTVLCVVPPIAEEPGEIASR